MCRSLSTSFARFPAWDQKWLFCAYMRLDMCVLSCFRSSETMPALSRPFHAIAQAQVPRQPIVTPSPDSDDFHSSPVRHSERVKVECYPMLGVIIKSPPDRLPNKTTTSANLRLQNPRRRQRNPKQSSRLSKNLSPHLRAGEKTTTPSKRCTCSSPAPVDTMGCDAANRNEMDPRVREAYHGISSNH
jgi:hypothetical protein